MPLLTPSTESATRVSPGQLQALLSIYHQDSLTGLVRVTPVQESSGEFFVLLYVNGQPLRMYQNEAKKYTRQNAESWSATLPQIEMDLQSYQFSAHFIRPLQIAFESNKINSAGELATQDVYKRIKELEKSPTPMLAHFEWPRADGFVLIPGGGLSSRQLLFFSPNQPNSIPNLARWPEPTCKLSTYEIEPDNEAWRENCLMLGLDFLYEQIFNRYDELVGASMTARLQEQLNNTARIQRWRISFNGRTLEDFEFFPAMKDMSRAYRSLLMSGQNYIASVVGENLFEESARAGFTSLPQVLQNTLAKENIFTYRL
jgi:hypothetical protein